MGIKTEDIRSIALVAHGGAGKTTLAEALLFDAGVTTRRGTVENGNTVSDYTAEEQKRHISIGTSLLNFDQKGKKVFMLEMAQVSFGVCGPSNHHLKIKRLALRLIHTD